MIDAYLNEAYAAKVLKKGNLSDVDSRLRRDFFTIHGLRDLAVLELKRLEKIPDERCFVSKVHREFLEGALNAGSQEG